MDSNSIIVNGKPLAPPEGLLVRNYYDPSVTRFAGRNRTGRPVTEVIIHESVTRGVLETVTVLQRRRLGVHLIVGPEGYLTQHADLAQTRLAHAGGHNGPSVGIEVVNPYYPHLLKPNLPWREVIDAPWAHKKEYVLPTPAQAEAVALLLSWLSSSASGLEIPRKWIGLRRGKLSLSTVAGAEHLVPGLYAHHYFAHADGSWLVLYAWLRLEAHLSAEVAYREATRRATGAKSRVDVTDLINAARLKE